MLNNDTRDIRVEMHTWLFEQCTICILCSPGSLTYAYNAVIRIFSQVYTEENPFAHITIALAWTMSNTRGRHSTTPKKVKQPPNTFLLYRAAKVPELYKGEVPNSMSLQRDISKRVAEMWHAESDMVKQYYRDLAKEKKEEHMLAHPDYKRQPLVRAKKEQLKDGKRVITSRAKPNDQDQTSQKIQAPVAEQTHTPEFERHTSRRLIEKQGVRIVNKSQGSPDQASQQRVVSPPPTQMESQVSYIDPAEMSLPPLLVFSDSDFDSLRASYSLSTDIVPYASSASFFQPPPEETDVEMYYDEAALEGISSIIDADEDGAPLMR
ncbi:hypothetical protein AcV7_003081 [Taiwanofungus camphoratus]|nr:hypothetical protein AcW2_005255 [Antrodia cinnamomea]KAI0940799.1 hypothetical protein AcV7_003081 [Antrodia cinnamomea]